MSEPRLATGEGWGFPVNSRKAHYFVEGRSLCGRWMYFGRATENQGASIDDCAACAKKLTKRRSAAEAKEGR